MRARNTNGNLINSGWIMENDDSIFFSDIISDNGTLFRVSKDGMIKEVFEKDKVLCMNIIDDSIYYHNHKAIYKLNINTKEKKEIYKASDQFRIEELLIYDESIYFSIMDNSNEKEKMYLYLVDINTSKYTIVSKNDPMFLNIQDNYIYYTPGLEPKSKLHRIKVDGTEEQRLNNENAWYPNILDDWIYYINEDENNNIFRIRLDGTEKTRLNNDRCNYMNVSGEWIYYRNYSDGYSLYKMKLAGTNKIKLNDHMSNNINVLGEWIYYYNHDFNSETVYRIKYDGTNIEKLHFIKLKE